MHNIHCNKTVHPKLCAKQYFDLPAPDPEPNPEPEPDPDPASIAADKGTTIIPIKAATDSDAAMRMVCSYELTSTKESETPAEIVYLFASRETH